MGTVAESTILGVLAHAECSCPLFSNFNKDRRHSSAAVTAVTERLFRAFSTGAPEVGAGLNFFQQGLFSSNFWLFHNIMLGLRFGFAILKFNYRKEIRTD